MTRHGAGALGQDPHANTHVHVGAQDFLFPLCSADNGEIVDVTDLTIGLDGALVAMTACTCSPVTAFCSQPRDSSSHRFR